MNRRKFIGNSAIAAAGASFFGVHDMLAGCATGKNIPFNDQARILHLDLMTGTALTELKTFYTSLLELPLISEQAGSFMIRAGETTINFIHTNEKGAVPFYHFAFNIPENKILKAREWQLKRTQLSATPSSMVDNGYPADIRHFRNWNAHSVFFWDPAGNLVEYIARHDLQNSSEGEFSSKDLVCASEIAFIVEDIAEPAEEIRSMFGLDQYRQGDQNFQAIGDENGLLLMIRKGRIWESHTDISRTPGTNRTAVTIRSAKTGKWFPGNYPFEVSTKT